MAIQSIGVTIGGVTKAVRGLRYSSLVGGVGRASFVVDDPSGSYIPADDAAVVISLGGSPVWSGEIAEVDVTYLGHAGVSCAVTAHDSMQLAQRGLINAILPSQTLKATLQYMTNTGGALQVVGVTLAAGQATGPTLGVITAPWWTPQQLLDHLTTLTGYVWRINASQVLEMWDVGTKSSGVTLSRANGNVVEASWTRERFAYRNRQWVIYGPSTSYEVTDDRSALCDGVTREFPLRYAAAATPTAVTVNSTPHPIGTYVVSGSLFEWMYRTSDNAIVQSADFGGGTTPPAGGSTLTVSMVTQGPNAVFGQDAAEVAARGEWNAAIVAPDITDYDEAYAYALALIRESIARPQVPRVVTRSDGIDPGETAVIDLSDVGLSSVTALVQQVDVDVVKANDQADPHYTLSCFAGSESVPTAVALWRRLLTGSSVAGGLATGGGGGGGVTTIVNGVLEGDLGGSRSEAVQHSTWVEPREYRDWRCPADGTYVAHVEVWTRDGATSVQPRIYDVTSAAAANTGTASTSTTPAKQQITFSGVAGREYRLQLLPGNTTHAVFGLGKVRS